MAKANPVGFEAQLLDGWLHISLHPDNQLCWPDLLIMEFVSPRLPVMIDTTGACWRHVFGGKS